MQQAQRIVHSSQKRPPKLTPLGARRESGVHATPSLAGCASNRPHHTRGDDHAI
jgi:hypothetical protein